MITAIVVDDEPKSVSMMITLIGQYCPQVSLLGSANSAADGQRLLESLKPQLVFLDVEMPYGSGFDLLASMPRIQAEVIFITAFDQYALKAFRFSAIDYLLKPVNIDDLQAAINNAEQRISEKKAARNYEVLLHNLRETDIAKQTLTFNDKGIQYLVKVADVMYIIADGSYIHIHTATRNFISTRNLKDYENELPPNVFCRIHHGHIVNKNFIARVQRGRGGVVTMKNGKVLEIAVRKKDAFLKMLKD